MMPAIEPLSHDALDTATRTLERAFVADPMFEWMFPDPHRRSRALVHLNRVPLVYGLRYGRVTQAERGRAVAIWIPPGKAVSAGRMLRSGMLGVPFRIGLGSFAKFMAANATMERIHKKVVPEPHWYLLVVGVDPELQGRGLGTALLQEGLAGADQANVPCYLETSDPRNIGFYERNGFAVVGTARLGDGGPPAWAMRRDSRATAA